MQHLIMFCLLLMGAKAGVVCGKRQGVHEARQAVRQSEYVHVRRPVQLPTGEAMRTGMA